MRISSVGYFARTEEECKRLSKIVTEVTHDSTEAVCAAEAVALAIYLAKAGVSKAEIRSRLEEYYDLDFTPDEIRNDYMFDCTCDGSVPQAIICFLESDSFEDAIRNAVSLGGDSDTQAAIAGSIAGAFYGVPDKLAREAMAYLTYDLQKTITAFEEYLRIERTGGKKMEQEKRQEIEIHDLAKTIRGKRIKAKSSDIEGYGHSVELYLYGCVRIGVLFEQGMLGKEITSIGIKDAVMLDDDSDIDLSELEVIYDNEAILGTLCKDIVSGFEGVADEIRIHPGMADTVFLQPQARKGNSELPKREAFDIARLQMIEKMVDPEEVQEPEPERKGGVLDELLRADRMML